MSVTFLLKNLCQVACLHEEILFKKAYIPMYLMQIVGITNFHPNQLNAHVNGSPYWYTT